MYVVVDNRLASAKVSTDDRHYFSPILIYHQMRVGAEIATVSDTIY